MLQLDIETADYIAASTVRDALVVSPSHQYPTVEATIQALFAAGKIDEVTASYILRNAARFCILPPPQFFDAAWHAEADVIAHSANPFVHVSSAQRKS